MQKRPEARKRAHTFGEKVFAVECEQKSEKERERGWTWLVVTVVDGTKSRLRLISWPRA